MLLWFDIEVKTSLYMYINDLRAIMLTIWYKTLFCQLNSMSYPSYCPPNYIRSVIFSLLSILFVTQL